MNEKTVFVTVHFIKPHR